MQFITPPTDRNVSDESEPGEDVSDMSEFVVDHIVSHQRDADGKMYLRIRWFGNERVSDTWEPLLHIPAELIQRFLKRKKFNPQDFRS